MNPILRKQDGTNPFATRFVKPGALAFEFALGESTAKLVTRLAASGWRGAIVGPHGSGKSTLLAALLAELQAQGHGILIYRLHDGQRRLSPSPAREAARLGANLLSIDGYEQLSTLARWRLAWLCRGRRLGLLVTSHQPTSLPTLYCTKPTPELVNNLVARLLGGELSPEWREAAERSFVERHGDVREVLFELYDLYELQRRS
jgi:hypothetical protein